MRLTTLALSLTALAVTAGAAFAVPPEKSVADLKAAYLGETTAQAKYAVYARQARKEGYAEVAALFRAASAAEGYHARNHRAVLAKLGETDLQAGFYTTAPAATRENLKDALQGESYERDTMYPQMLQNARAEGQTDVVRTLTFARDAEKQHAALYAAALKSMRRQAPGARFYVCPECGATFRSTAPTACPTCGTRREKFRLIS